LLDIRQKIKAVEEVLTLARVKAESNRSAKVDLEQEIAAAECFAEHFSRVADYKQSLLQAAAASGLEAEVWHRNELAAFLFAGILHK
jgi:Zn-dependent M28 family amino/carboxypeptidase